MFCQSRKNAVKSISSTNISTDYLLDRTDNPNIAKDNEIAALTARLSTYEKQLTLCFFDGRPLDEDDIDFITAVLSTHFKAKEK